MLFGIVRSPPNPTLRGNATRFRAHLRKNSTPLHGLDIDSRKTTQPIEVLILIRTRFPSSRCRIFLSSNLNCCRIVLSSFYDFDVSMPDMYAFQPDLQSVPQQKDNASAPQYTPNILPCRIHHDGPIDTVGRFWEPVADEKGIQRNVALAEYACSLKLVTVAQMS